MSSEISTASSTVDFGAMNSSFGNYLQFPQQYMQFIEPSELKTPCQPALPNHEFSCPISGKLQHSPVGSEGSALSSTSKGSLTMSNSNTLRRLSIKQQILFAYSNHKRSTGQSGDSLVSFVNHLHSTVCQNLNCFCDRLHALLSHCDNSLTATSSNCNLVLYTNINSKLQQNSEDVNCIHVRKLNRTYSDNMLPPRKRVKEQHPFCPISSENRTTSLSDAFMSELCYLEVFRSLEQWPKSPVSVNSEAVDFVKSEVTEVMDSRSLSKEVKHAEETMPTNPKIGSASLLDYFSADQIKEHISSLKLSSGLRTSSEEKKFVQVDDVNSHHCQLCSKTELVLAPVPIYCSRCATRIKRGVIYYRMKEGNGVQACFCSSCYKLSRGARITFHGFDIPKAKLEKQKNNQTIGELWIQCDKCERWQHQICALFNNRRNPDEKAVYLCPKCWLEYTESREKMPLPKATAFGARDLPITELSNHIEERLYRRLQQEREERARSSRMNLEQVPGPEDLVVREVLSVKKQVEVKKKLLDVFMARITVLNFHTDQRLEVILLFQKIEGVEVCLFGMFVQEFGSECGNPNQRCVYISYLDSVKYFRPETQTTTGEALRTFVYHEILIGYLESCKKRGFSTCYLWAFPHVKGEDYILYCHPDTQKTPKPDKLRQWYHSMLRKAARENIVVNCTNLYDQFFVPTTSPYCPKITAARLPYLDDYYWPDIAENVITNMEKHCGGNLEVELKKVMSQRALKAMGYSNPSGNAIKDTLLMHKLGQTISAVKEDFIIVDLQFVCSQCQEVILSGSLWSCSQCKNFQLCERCQDSERMRIGENAHSFFNAKDTHPLSKVMLDVPAATIDDEPIIESCLFQSKYSVLEFCVRNNYQFDTLRRAKHSSMMILHELERTMAAIGAACSIHQDKG